MSINMLYVVLGFMYMFFLVFMCVYVCYKGSGIISSLCIIAFVLILRFYWDRLRAVFVGYDEDILIFTGSVAIVSFFSNLLVHRVVRVGVSVKDYPRSNDETNQKSYLGSEVTQMLKSNHNCELSELMKYAMLRYDIEQKMYSKPKKCGMTDDQYREMLKKKLNDYDRCLLKSTEFFHEELEKRINKQ